MRLVAYLTFDGQCEAAFRFYERCLSGKILAMFPYAGSPLESQMPTEKRALIMHATPQVGDAELNGSDVPPGRYEKPAGFCVSIQIKGAADAERIFSALSENANVTMPIQETFWAARFGTLTDQFGIPWIINCENSNA
jgi:PhnB protein